MEVPTHPLLELMESNANCLKSMLTHYIDATVDNQFASLRISILNMIQSGIIGPQQNHDVTSFVTTSPPPTQANTDQSSAQCSHEYSNDTLIRTHEHQNNLQNEVSFVNTIKQEFDDDYDKNDEIDYDNVMKNYEEEYLNHSNCVNRVCDLDDENNSNHLNIDVTAGDGDETNLDETQLQIDVNSTNNTQMQNIVINEVTLRNTINSNDPMIKQEFDDDEKDDDGEKINDDNVTICGKTEKEFFTSVREIYDNTSRNYPENEGEPSDEPQPTNYSSLENNQTNEWIISNDQQVINAIDDATENIELQVNDQSDHLKNMHSGKSRDRSVIESSTSGVQSLTRKRFPKKVFGDAQLDANPRKSVKRNQLHEKSSRTVKRPKMDSTQPNLAQPNRDLQCSHCHKSFDYRCHYQRHLRVHTGERPFQCDQCDKKFTEKSKLTRHQLIHQNIKRFRCPECEKQFTRKDYLDTHLLIHSGERPFACRHCEQLFKDSSGRNSHEQAIHLHVKPYRCKQCGHTASKRSAVIKHIRMVHFGLPKTIKEQQTLNIIDQRDPGELVEKV